MSHKIDEIIKSEYVIEIRTLCVKVWNAAVEECAEKARCYIGANEQPFVSKGSILSLKIEDDEK